MFDLQLITQDGTNEADFSLNIIALNQEFKQNVIGALQNPNIGLMLTKEIKNNGNLPEGTEIKPKINGNDVEKDWKPGIFSSR